MQIANTCQGYGIFVAKTTSHITNNQGSTFTELINKNIEESKDTTSTVLSKLELDENGIPKGMIKMDWRVDILSGQLRIHRDEISEFFTFIYDLEDKGLNLDDFLGEPIVARDGGWFQGDECIAKGILTVAVYDEGSPLDLNPTQQYFKNLWDNYKSGKVYA
jgi:hypothetical protein